MRTKIKEYLLIICSSMILGTSISVIISSILEYFWTVNYASTNDEIIIEDTSVREYYEHKEEVLRFISKVNPNIKYKNAQLLWSSIEKHFYRTGLTFYQFLSIAGIESGFKKNSISTTNDYGIFQINKSTYMDFCERRKLFSCEWEKILDIDHNTFVSSIILETYRKVIMKKYPSLSSEMVSNFLIVKYNTGSMHSEKGLPYHDKWDKMKYKMKQELVK